MPLSIDFIINSIAWPAFGGMYTVAVNILRRTQS